MSSNSAFNRFARFKALVALSLIAGLGSYGLGTFVQAQQQQEDRREQAQSQAREGLRHADALSNAFQEVARTIGPSVVNIRSTVEAPQQTMRPSQRQPDPGMMEDFFRDLPPSLRERFRGFEFGPLQPNQPTPPRVGEGSGLIAREDGYILTNNHVVANASEIRVTLPDEKEYTATVVGTDPETDLAVVKIDASGLTPAKFGNSDKVEVGEWVLAIGSPFGLQRSVTAGIVSAKGRQVGIIRDPRGFSGFEDFIQTDAAINPGNSGGPLANLHGEVIAINTAITTGTGYYQGVGFAIPSNMARAVMESIIETGSVRRGALGVQIQSLTEREARAFGYSGTDGALIAEVYPRSGAEKAGLRYGDIITKIDGQAVEDNRALMNAVASHQPGETIEVEVFRNGKTRTYTVTLGDRSQQFALSDGADTDSQANEDGSPAGKATELGLTVEELTPEIAAELSAGDRRGVVISRVNGNSPAAREGLARGDIILRVGEAEVATVEQFNTAIARADIQTGVPLQVFRDGRTRIVVLHTEE